MTTSSAAAVGPCPLVLAPILMEKVWGGTRLAALGKPLPPGKNIGESWELADLSATSASGGGGAAARSIIASGPLAGTTLHEALELWGPALTGSLKLTPQGNIPLLIKFLDARENLSVQVHPSPAYAASHPGAHLKTECWIILDAAPGAVIYKGIRPGVTREAFERHIADGTVASDLISEPAVVGECHNLPSGTCHALGAGVLVAEVQTPSDTTFRVFDWGRVGRELHVEQAMACIDFAPAPPTTSLKPGHSRGTLVETEFFTVERIRSSQPIPAGEGMTAWMVLGGRGAVSVPGSPVNDVPFERGQTLVIPAACAAAASLVPQGEIDVLRVVGAA